MDDELKQYLLDMMKQINDGNERPRRPVRGTASVAAPMTRTSQPATVA